MKTNDIIRAWRDAEFLNSLSEEERAMLPANPAGDIELSDDDLAGVNGANVSVPTPVITTTPIYVTWVFRCVTRLPPFCRG